LERFYNLVVDAGDMALVVSVLVLLPLALFRSKRRISGVGLKYTAYIMILNLWMYSLAVLWHYWGLIAVIVGILFTPIGASLIAIGVATAQHNWWPLFCIVSDIGIVTLAYVGGEKLIESGESSKLH
jgi:hypothetical protein